MSTEVRENSPDIVDRYMREIKWYKRYPMYMEELDKDIAMYLVVVEPPSVAGLIRELLVQIRVLELNNVPPQSNRTETGESRADNPSGSEASS